MILWGNWVVVLYNLSRVRSLLRTLAIAEYGMDDSIKGTVKEGNRSIVFVYVSVQLGLDGCGVGSSAVLALRRSGRQRVVKGGSSLRRIMVVHRYQRPPATLWHPWTTAGVPPGAYERLPGAPPLVVHGRPSVPEGARVIPGFGLGLVVTSPCYIVLEHGVLGHEPLSVCEVA